MRRPAGRWNFTVNGKPAAVDVPPPTAGAKPVSRSSHAKGLRRRAGAHLRRSCHANPIRWLADGFAGSNPTCPARQSVSASVIEGRKRRGPAPFRLSRVPAKGVLNDGVKGQIFKSSRLVVECKYRALRATMKRGRRR